MRIQTSPRSQPLPRPSDRRGNVAIVMIVILALAAVGFGVYWFVFRGGGSGADATTQLYTRLPDAPSRVIVRPNRVVNSEFVGSLSGLFGGGGGGVSTLKTEMEAKLGISLDDIDAVAFAFSDDSDDGVAVAVYGDVNVATGTAVLSLLKTEFSLSGVMAGSTAPAFEQIDSRHVVGGLGPLGAKAVAAFQRPAVTPDETAVRMLGHIDTGAAVWGSWTFDTPLDVVSLFDLPPIPVPGLSKAGKVKRYTFSVDTTDVLRARTSAELDRPAGPSADVANSVKSMVARFAGSQEKALLDAIEIRADDTLLNVNAVVTQTLVSGAVSGAGGGLSPFSWLNF